MLALQSELLDMPQPSMRLRNPLLDDLCGGLDAMNQSRRLAHEYARTVNRVHNRIDGSIRSSYRITAGTSDTRTSIFRSG